MHYRRLRLQLTAYSIVSLVLIVGTAMWLFRSTWRSASPSPRRVIYTAWTPHLVRGLELSAERMSDR